MAPPPAAGLTRRIAGEVERLFPGYFALVMATGIVSIAAHQRHMPRIAWALLGVNIFAYAVLALLLSARLVWYFSRVLEDLNNHARAPGFFTVVADTCVLGSQIAIVIGRHDGGPHPVVRRDRALGGRDVCVLHRHRGPRVVAEPVLAGLHRGDVSRLSVRALFPVLANAERKHGSVARAWRSMPARSANGGSMSLREGLAQVVIRMQEQLPPGVAVTGMEVLAIERDGITAAPVVARIDSGPLHQRKRFQGNRSARLLRRRANRRRCSRCIPPHAQRPEVR